MSTSKKASLKQLNNEEIQERVQEKKRELEHNYYDAVTKFEVNERKIEKEIKENQNEEEKANLEKKFEDIKSENEKVLDQKKT